MIDLNRVALAMLLPVLAAGVEAAEMGSLPLASGNQWQLVNAATGAAYTVSIPSSQTIGDKRIARMVVTTPFWSLDMLVSPSAQGLAVEGMNYPSGRYYMESPMPLFNEAASVGQSWTSFLGPVTLIEKGVTVNTPAGTFTNCYRFRILFGGNQPMDWFLAPNVGVVRIGADTFPFLLKTAVAKPYEIAPKSGVVGTCPKIGIIPNPPANGDFSSIGQLSALNTAMANGMRFMNISASWKELEPSPGVYNFTELQRYMNWAQSTVFEAALTIKTIDNTSLALPPDLAGRALNDTVVLSRFRAMLVRLAPSVPSAVKYVHFANEVTAYFAVKPGDLTAFLNFHQSAVSQWKTSGKTQLTGMTFSFADFRRDDSIFRILREYSEQISFTYYPMKSDWTIRDPALMAWDVAEMVLGANSKTVVFTEAGFPSSTDVGSNDKLQDDFYSHFIDEVRKYPGKIAGVSFFLMSDIPPATVSYLTTYYENPAVVHFGNFLSSLGTRSPNNTPKLAWGTFSSKAQANAAATSCAAGY